VKRALAEQDVLEQVRRIGAHSVKSPETAHALEDALYLAVLAYIAQGGRNPAGLAAAALQSRKYEFGRFT
jgi:hypothetical protein